MEHVDKLRKMNADFNQQYAFVPGQLVKWKEGLKNRRMPDYNEEAVVVEVLSTPVSDERDSGTPYFGEPLDIKIGIIDKDGDFVIYHYDSRRFKPAE